MTVPMTPGSWCRLAQVTRIVGQAAASRSRTERLAGTGQSAGRVDNRPQQRHGAARGRRAGSIGPAATSAIRVDGGGREARPRGSGPRSAHGLHRSTARDGLRRHLAIGSVNQAPGGSNVLAGARSLDLSRPIGKVEETGQGTPLIRTSCRESRRGHTRTPPGTQEYGATESTIREDEAILARMSLLLAAREPLEVRPVREGA